MSEGMKDKIRKLLVLAADKGANEHEKQRAMEMAQMLMLKFNISVDIDSVDAQIQKGDVWGRQYDKTWHKLIASAVSYMYVCKNLRYNPGFMFIGRPESIDACQFTMTWIIDQIEEKWRLFAKTCEHSVTMTERNNFKFAAANTVWQRIRKMMDDVQKSDALALEYTGSKALVVVDSIKQQLDGIEDYIQKNIKTKTCRTIAPRKSLVGIGAGEKAGQSVQFKQEIATMKADLKQCETIITHTNPWTFGGKATSTERCLHVPTTVVKEKKTGNELSCCATCILKFKSRNKDDMHLYTLTAIKQQESA